MCKCDKPNEGQKFCWERFGFGLVYSVPPLAYGFYSFGKGLTNTPILWWCLAASAFGVGIGLINSWDHHRKFYHYLTYCVFALLLSSLAAFVGASINSKPGQDSPILFFATSALIGIVAGFTSDRWGDIPPRY